MRPNASEMKSSSTVVLSDQWWKSAISKGDNWFRAQNYDKSSIEFFRALKLIESLYEVYYQAVIHRHPIDCSQVEQRLYVMYTTTCYKLAESFYRRGYFDLTEHYLESAVCLMARESQSKENAHRCVGCVNRYYERALNMLVEYLRYRAVPESEICDRVSLLILTA